MLRLGTGPPPQTPVQVQLEDFPVTEGQELVVLVLGNLEMQIAKVNENGQCGGDESTRIIRGRAIQNISQLSKDGVTQFCT